MRKRISDIRLSVLLLTITLLICFGCSKKDNKEDSIRQEVNNVDKQDDSDSKGTRDKQKIIEEMVVDYGNYNQESYGRVVSLLDELKTLDEDTYERWEDIMKLWEECNTNLDINYDVLPDGLLQTDELCIVVLGFQLNPDGSMKEELIQRLTVVLNSALKYPNAMIVCTGGGTADEDKEATEAGKMAEWLIEHGIDSKRIIVEDKSVTTAQNAIYTFDYFENEYQDVKELAIVSSDYHIATGKLLFEAESILRAEKQENEKIHVVSNAAWKAPSGSLSTMFQAGALIELSGDVKTAFEIYYDTYDIHKLPSLDEGQ